MVKCTQRNFINPLTLIKHLSTHVSVLMNPLQQHGLATVCVTLTLASGQFVLTCLVPRPNAGYYQCDVLWQSCSSNPPLHTDLSIILLNVSLSCGAEKSGGGVKLTQHLTSCRLITIILPHPFYSTSIFSPSVFPAWTPVSRSRLFVELSKIEINKVEVDFN